jgi:hypothetical protein
MIAEVRGMIGRMRDSHHRIAQMMAMGWTDSQIRRITGITSRRLALYRADPAMQDVVAKYSKEGEEKLEEFGDFFNELMTSNRVRGELLIADAFEEAMEGERDISLTVIDKIVQGRADRTGYGKTSKVEHKHDFATRLDNAIQRSGKTIEGQVSLASPPDVVTQLPAPVPDPPAREPIQSTRAAPEPPNIAKVLHVPFQRRG